MTKNTKKKDDKIQSFLHETQKEGQASGKVALKDLDSAMAEMTHVINEEAVEFYKKTPEEKWPTCKVAVFSHEVRDIVPAGVGKTKRGKDRIVCGVTGSKKVSLGREEALRKFYHVEEKKEEDKASEEKKGKKSA